MQDTFLNTARMSVQLFPYTPAWLFSWGKHFFVLRRCLQLPNQSMAQPKTKERHGVSSRGVCEEPMRSLWNGPSEHTYHEVHQQNWHAQDKVCKNYVSEDTKRQLLLQISIQEVILVVQFPDHHHKGLHDWEWHGFKLFLRKKTKSLLYKS